VRSPCTAAPHPRPVAHPHPHPRKRSAGRPDASRCLSAEYARADTYFLTHTHADHLQGLNEAWEGGTIYCSPIAATLLNQRYPTLQAPVVALEVRHHLPPQPHRKRGSIGQGT
jgi:glyoxylase-like metal-dependent hydrolase (beta-lactamase superfamily II)